jgi:hypothetical protein
MSRTGLYILVGILAVVVIGLGIYIYNEQNKPGLDVHVDSQGISIEGNG